MMEGFARDISTSTSLSSSVASSSTIIPITEHSGIAARLMEDVFTNLQNGVNNIIDFTVKVSCLEIYNENVYDLLSLSNKTTSSTGSTTTLQPSSTVIRENEKGETVVTGLTEVKVNNSNEMALALYRGMNARQTASTLMNERSSRSHAIFTMIIEQTVSTNDENSNNMNNMNNMTNGSNVSTMVRRTSRIHLVDLAGSERTKRTQASGDRLREATNINKSLLALGNVIKALATIEDGDTALSNGSSSATTVTGDRQHIPYRDSKLTRLLKDSLGGNAYTLMIACASPADTNVEETMSTLHYAARARTITNKAVINTDPMSAALASLRKQVKELSEQLTEARAMAGMGRGSSNGYSSSVSSGSGIVQLPLEDITNITLSDGSTGHATPCPCGRVLHIGCSSSSSNDNTTNGTTMNSHPSNHHTTNTLPPSATAAVSSAMQKVLTAESANRRLLDENNALKTQLVHVRNESNKYFDNVCRTETINDTLRLHLNDLTKAVRNSLNRVEQYKTNNPSPTDTSTTNNNDDPTLVPLASFNDLPWLTDLAEKALIEATVLDNDDDNASLMDDDDETMNGQDNDYNNLEIDLSDLAVSVNPSGSSSTSTVTTIPARTIRTPFNNSQSTMNTAAVSASRVQAVRTELVAITDALQAKQRLLSAYESMSTEKNSNNKENGTNMNGKVSSVKDDAMQRVEAELNKVSTALANVTAERNRLQTCVDKGNTFSNSGATSMTSVFSSSTSPTNEDYATLKAQLTVKLNEITTLQNRQNELKRLLALRNKADTEKARLVEDIQSLRQHKAVLSKSLRDEQTKQRLEVKKAQAAATAALREANKAQLEGLRMKTQLENNQIVMKRTMEEKAALQKRMKEQTGEIAQLRTAARAQVLNTTPMDMLNQQLVPYSSVHSYSSTTTNPSEILTCSTHDTFYAVAAAQAAVQGINGKGVLYSKQMHSSIAAAVRKGLIPAPDHNDDTNSSMPIISEELDEQVPGGFSNGNNNDEDHGVSSVNSVPADGLISLADCFANVAAIRVPSTLRSLLEGDIAARVTLRRASTLAQKLASERKLLVTRKTQRLESTNGSSTHDSVVQALDTQIAVTTMQLNTVLDVIVTLKTQLQADTSSSNNGTNSNRGIRARAKGWANEVTDIHAAKKTIKWLSYTATALADSCDVAVQEANLERVRADEQIHQIRKEQEASDQLRRNAEALVRNQQAEIQFLLNQATQSVLSSVTDTNVSMDTETIIPYSGDTAPLTHLLRVQEQQLYMYKEDTVQMNDLRTKLSELETTLEQTKQELRTVQASEREAKSALAAELYSTTGSKTKTNNAKPNNNNKGNKSNTTTGSAVSEPNRTSLAMTEEEMQILLQTALSSKPVTDGGANSKPSRTSTGSAGTFTFNEDDQPLTRRSRTSNNIVTYDNESDSDEFDDGEDDDIDDAGARDDSEDEDFNESFDEDDYDDNGKKKKKKNTTTTTTNATKAKGGKTKSTKPVAAVVDNDAVTVTGTLVGKKRRSSSTSETINGDHGNNNKDDAHDHKHDEEDDDYHDDGEDGEDDRKPRKASKTNQGTRKTAESCKCKATKGACKNCACKKAGRKCGSACKCESGCCVNRDTINDSSNNNDANMMNTKETVPIVTDSIPMVEISAALVTPPVTVPTTTTTGANNKFTSTMNSSVVKSTVTSKPVANVARTSNSTVPPTNDTSASVSRTSIGSTKSAVSTGSATSQLSSKSFGSTTSIGLANKSSTVNSTSTSSMSNGSAINRPASTNSFNSTNTSSRSISNSRFSSLSTSSTIRPSMGSTFTGSSNTSASLVRRPSLPPTTVSSNGATSVPKATGTNNTATNLSSTVNRPALGTLSQNKNTSVVQPSSTGSSTFMKKPIMNSTINNSSTINTAIPNRFSMGNSSSLHSTNGKPVNSNNNVIRPTTIR